MSAPIVAVLLSTLAIQAHAVEVVNFSTWKCDVANTTCSLVTDDQQIISAVFLPTSGTLTITELDADYNVLVSTETAPIVVGTVIKNSLYQTTVPFTVTYPSGAVLSGQINKVRSGSGRGGWAWHVHWWFISLVQP